MPFSGLLRLHEQKDEWGDIDVSHPDPQVQIALELLLRIRKERGGSGRVTPEEARLYRQLREKKVPLRRQHEVSGRAYQTIRKWAGAEHGKFNRY